MPDTEKTVVTGGCQVDSIDAAWAAEQVRQKGGSEQEQFDAALKVWKEKQNGEPVVQDDKGGEIDGGTEPLERAYFTAIIHAARGKTESLTTVELGLAALVVDIPTVSLSEFKRRIGE